MFSGNWNNEPYYCHNSACDQYLHWNNYPPMLKKTPNNNWWKVPNSPVSYSRSLVPRLHPTYAEKSGRAWYQGVAWGQGPPAFSAKAGCGLGTRLGHVTHTLANHEWCKVHFVQISMEQFSKLHKLSGVQLCPFMTLYCLHEPCKICFSDIIMEIILKVQIDGRIWTLNNKCVHTWRLSALTKF